ncbi:MAG: hypothetical protein OXL37_00045 [Chloroflexota bacterium]|nr:hypothetical protein [Chloroflexota bacterium]MDE2959383.1 hypothetical protein [Chloroflexota bacterium]
MEATPLTIFYGSMLGLVVAALFVIMFRQGRSPTHSDMRELERQTRDELRAEIREAVRTATLEITAEMNRNMAEQTAESNRRMDEMNHRIDEMNHRIDEMNHRIDETNRRIDRVLTTLANHEHLDGRVVVAMRPDSEPAPAVVDN